MNSIIAKITVWLLKRKDISIEDKTFLTAAILQNLHALPIRSIINFNEQGTLLIQGKALEMDQVKQIRESAVAGLRSVARKLIRDQISFEAIKKGVHEGMTPEQVLFSKAVLWWGEQEELLYHSLSGE